MRRDSNLLSTYPITLSIHRPPAQPCLPFQLAASHHSHKRIHRIPTHVVTASPLTHPPQVPTGSPTSVLRFKLASWSLDGTWLGLADLTDQLQLCSSGTAQAIGWTTVGIGYKVGIDYCTCECGLVAQCTPCSHFSLAAHLDSCAVPREVAIHHKLWCNATNHRYTTDSFVLNSSPHPTPFPNKPDTCADLAPSAFAAMGVSLDPKKSKWF